MTRGTMIGKGTPTNSEPAGTSSVTEFVIYQQSPIFYWWPVWFYGYGCALWTFLFGSSFDIGGHKAVKVYSGPWLGFSFLILLLIILWFSHIKARGIYSLVLFLLILIAAMVVQGVGAWSPMFSQLALLLVYMNQAFYVVISSGFLLIWALSVFVVDRMRFWRFKPGQVIESDCITQEEFTYDTRNMKIKRLPSDFLVHKILGLAFIGGGTGDLELTTAGLAGIGGNLVRTTMGTAKERILIENVWRVKKRQRQIEELIAIGPAEVR